MFLTHVARAMAADLEQSDYNEGCPIATTALETAAQSEVLGAATRTAFQKWELEIKRGLFRFGLTSGDADLVATMVLSQLEGALLLARTYRSLAPIQRAEEAVRLLVRFGRRYAAAVRLATLVPICVIALFRASPEHMPATAYVVAAAQWGKHPGGRTTYGKSCIVDPWGEVDAQASEGEGARTDSKLTHAGCSQSDVMDSAAFET